MSPMAGRQEEQGKSEQWGINKSLSPIFEDAVVALLVEKFSPALAIHQAPAATPPPCSLDPMENPAKSVLLPVICLVVCAFIKLEQRQSELLHLKTLQCFFLPAPSQHLLEKKCFVAVRFTVKAFCTPWHSLLAILLLHLLPYDPAVGGLM